MAIVYDWYENPNAEGDPEERGLHPRPLLNGKVSMKQLYARVHARSSLTTGDVMNAIDCLTQICGEELREGREVHIEGLGYFSPTLEATQKVTRQHAEQASESTAKEHQFPSRRQSEECADRHHGHPEQIYPPLPTPLGSRDRHAPERVLRRTRRTDSLRFSESVRYGTHHRQRTFKTAAGGRQAAERRAAYATHLPPHAGTLRHAAGC